MSVKSNPKFASSGYNIEVTGRQVAVTEAMKAYATEKIGKMEHFADRIIDVHCTMDIQKLDHTVVIVMKVGHYLIKVQASSPDMYASIDKAIDKLRGKLIKYQKRIRDHHGSPVHEVDMKINVFRRPSDEVDEINEAIDDENRQRQIKAWGSKDVVKVEKMKVKTLTLEEAILKMELSDDAFMVYHAQEDKDQHLRVIYRREDGDYGVIEPR